MNDELNERLDRLSERVERLERGWVTAPTLANPEPLPEWRALVDQISVPKFVYPLPAILRDIAYLDEATDKRGTLARIVAVCEADSGDVKADPDRAWSDGQGFSVRLLVDALGDWTYGSMVALGDRAAAWLRYLTTTGEGK